MTLGTLVSEVVPLGAPVQPRAGYGLMKPLRILVTGSRVWPYYEVIRRALREATWTSKGPITIVHGQCDPRTPDGKVVRWKRALNHEGPLIGADWYAHQVALEYGWTPDPHPAQWETLGNSAGHRRNAEMVKLGADLCLGFPLGESPGTRGCLIKAVAARIPVRSYEGE